MKSNMRYLLFVIFCGALFSGCSMRLLAVRSTARIMEMGMPAYTEEEDFELAEKSMASTLKLVEAFLKNDPDNPRLLEMASSGYCGYSLMFVEDESPERAAIFYKRGADYGERLLNLRKIAEGGKLAAEKARKKDVPAVFWNAFCRAGYLQLSMDNPDAIAGLSRIEPAAARVAELDPGYYYGGPRLLLGALYGSRPKMFGGDLEKSRINFEASLKGNGGGFLMNRLVYAKTYAVQAQDRELFEKLLSEVLSAPDSLPEQRLANGAAKRKAKRLMEKIDELF